MPHQTVTLWSSLIKSSAKREIACPPGLDVTREQFASALKAKIEANQLPASAELVRVNWDETGTVQDLVLVRYAGNDSKSDVLRFAVGLEQLGRFAYLEKKVLLAPPRLHKVRAEKKLLTEKGTDWFSPSIGVIALIAGIALVAVGGGLTSWGGDFFTIVCTAPGVIALVVGIIALISSAVSNSKARDEDTNTRAKNKEIEAWNAKARQERESLTNNLDNWQAQVLEVAYLGRANDVFGRWTSAISTTIDQVIHDLFIARQAQASAWDEQQRSKEEIEKELQRRRQEAFS